MLGFSKGESLAVAIILTVLVGATLLNLRVAQRRARDEQRKSDVRNISDGLAKYYNDFAFYPLASGDGRILSCGKYVPPNTTDFNFRPCVWGDDSIVDLTDPNYPPYVAHLPADPQSQDGVNYLYISNGKRFQILASLEGTDEVGYDPKIVARNLKCGKNICNFGIASSGTPIDKSIEEYEESLKPKR
jgi:type II secretory pathway pseudopilin PulG